MVKDEKSADALAAKLATLPINEESIDILCDEAAAEVEDVADAIRQHGAHDINYFGTQVNTTLEP